MKQATPLPAIGPSIVKLPKKRFSLKEIYILRIEISDQTW
jgi:hypothetical protein